MLEGRVAGQCWRRELKKSVGGKCCREVFVEEGWREVLWRWKEVLGVGEECCREVLGTSVGDECCKEVLDREVL